MATSHNNLTIGSTAFGGLILTRRLAAWADVHNILIAPHNVGGPVSTAVALHVAACTPNFMIQEHFNDFADSWVKEAAPGLPEVVDGSMKLLTFHRNNVLELGILTEAGVIDVAQASKVYDGIPLTIDAAIRGGTEAMKVLQGLAEPPAANWLLNEPDLQPGPCVGSPEKLICIGLNYRRHARETGMAVPETPVLFSKFNNTLAATGELISLPDNAVQYDYEVELGVVIGKEARYVTVDEALDYVFGYFTVNDMSVRDLQFRTSQWLLGKTLDRFFPMAPYLVTADEVDDPQNLGLSCWVNGELRQNSNTADMIFSVAECISYISQYMTLKPGDVISTGTPEGVVMGMKEKNWLKPGDEVVVEVEGLGKCTNRMV